MNDKNQGEGDKISAEKYNKETTEFAKSGRVEAAAQDAKKALEGKERKDLDAAEAEGKSHAHGEDPQVKR
jgi:hypothetical protein